MADVKLPHISRRALLGAAGATAATSSMGWAAVKKEVETLKKKGWKAYPVGCCMCGARCGMLAMHKEGFPIPIILSAVIAAAVLRRSGHGIIRCAFASP